MKIVVQKYGGSSVGSPEKIKLVAQRIYEAKSEDTAIVVVVSAMGDTTDHLLELARSVTPKPPRRELDMLLTSGERISMALLSMALWELNCPATSFTGSQCGMITDSVHTRARILSVNAERIINELQKGYVVIAAGFQGVSAKREITTLGRGGSDTSAVALALALGADICEIYTDVNGICSADPRSIPDTELIAYIDYEQILDLANFGARVMHSRSIELARQYNMPVSVRSASSKEPGTYIKSISKHNNGETMEKPRITALTSRCDVIRVRGTLSQNDFSDLFKYLRQERFNLMHPQHELLDGMIRFSFWMPEDECDSFCESVWALKLSVDKDLGIFAVTGFELFVDIIMIEDLLSLLSQISVIHGFSSTSTGLFFFLPKNDLDMISKIVHKRFIAVKKMNKKNYSVANFSCYRSCRLKNSLYP
jgi:aspartate kinase